jgi:two-component system OmpR family sensor kinase
VIPFARAVIGVAATSTKPLSRAKERSILLLAIAGPILIAAVAVAAWIVTGAALRPVRRMAGEAATISAAEPGRRLPSLEVTTRSPSWPGRSTRCSTE